VDKDEFERMRREIDAAIEEHREFVKAARRDLREAMAAARREMRETVEEINAQMRFAQAEFRAETERGRRADDPFRDGFRSGTARKRRGGKGSWWDPFLRAHGQPPRPPRRPRKDDGGETEPVEPRPKPAPLQGGAEAPIE
jgi:hypothetical protein